MNKRFVFFSPLLLAFAGTSVVRAELASDAALQKEHLGDKTVQESTILRDHAAPLSREDTTKNTVALTEKNKDMAQAISSPARDKAELVFQPRFTEASVTTSPYLGLRSAWDGGDLIVNLPSINEDFRLLQHRERLASKLHARGRSFDQRPLLEISGALAGLVSWSQSDEENTATDIDLDTAQLDLLAEVSHRILGFMSFTYDHADLSASGARVSQSRLFLKRGFIVVGDTEAYMTLGQMFLPFGNYASSMLSSPITATLGKTNARALLVGGMHDNVHVAAYLFNGETITSGSGINNWGAELDYHHTYTPFHQKLDTKLGFSYLSTLANSAGMQSTGGSDFVGFDHLDGSVNGQVLQHQVPGINGFIHVAQGPYALKGEYITATRHFASENLSFDGHGAKPAAVQAEISYRFTGLDKPIAAAIAYHKSWQALALHIPRDSWSIGLSHACFKNSITSFEFRHTNDYNVTNTASGQGNAVHSTGGHSNTITMQFKIYF